MPVFNEERFLSQTLDSLLAQDYSNFEIIICDNASTDKTGEIAQKYAEKDSRIKYHLNESNIGGTRNFNKTFLLSSGKYFMWASGHDLYDKSFISKCLNIFKAENKVVLVYPITSSIDCENNNLGKMPGRLDTRALNISRKLHCILWGIPNGNPVYGLIQRNAMEKTLIFQNVLGMDLVFLLELSLVGDFAHISEELFYRRETHLEEKNESANQRRLNHTHLKKISGASLLPYWYLVYKNLMVIKKINLNKFKKTGLFVSIFFNLIIIYGLAMLRDLKKIWGKII